MSFKINKKNTNYHSITAKEIDKLEQSITKLCEDIKTANHNYYFEKLYNKYQMRKEGYSEDFISRRIADKKEELKELEVKAEAGKIYVKIYVYEPCRFSSSHFRTWGFVNIRNADFKVGDIFLGNSGRPALNKARGNVLEGYNPIEKRCPWQPEYLI